MHEWTVRDVDQCWQTTRSPSRSCRGAHAVDVLAHPDLVKVGGNWPNAP